MALINFKPIIFFMKYFLLALFSFPLFAAAQDSCGLKRETDAFTHQTKITTGFRSFPVNGLPLQISIDATAKEVDFFFWIRSDNKCFDDASTAQINFEGDRLKANYKNSGSMNCEGAFHFTFKNAPTTPSALKRMTDKAIKNIKLTGNGGAVTEIDFSPEQQAQLMKMANCVVTEAKTLLGK